jgi:hypothetical protein
MSAKEALVASAGNDRQKLTTKLSISFYSAALSTDVTCACCRVWESNAPSSAFNCEIEHCQRLSGRSTLLSQSRSCPVLCPCSPTPNDGSACG